MANSYNVIFLKAGGSEDIEKGYEEGVAGEAGIYPGMIVKVSAVSATDVNTCTVLKQTEQKVKVECLIVTEDMNVLQGKTVTDVYASGDPISYCKVQPGDEVQVYMAATQDVDPTSFLTPNTAGAFIEVTSTDYRMFKCLETNAATALGDLIAARAV